MDIFKSRAAREALSVLLKNADEMRRDALKHLGSKSPLTFEDNWMVSFLEIEVTHNKMIAKAYTTAMQIESMAMGLHAAISQEMMKGE